MKLRSLFSLAILLSLSACSAQKNMVTVSNAYCGNSAHRGIEMRDKDDNPMPRPRGKDYYSVFLTAHKAATIELVSLTLKSKEGKSMTLKPQFTEGGQKRYFKANESATIRVEFAEEGAPVPLGMNENSVLMVKIGKKKYSLTIAEFMMVMPP